MLQLTLTGDGVGYGLIRGHAVALFGRTMAQGYGGTIHVHGSAHSQLVPPSLTIQVGHTSARSKLPKPAAIQWGSGIAPQVANGNARCDIEDRRSILFLFNASFLTDVSKLVDVVFEFLSCMETAGVLSHSTRCHWCGHRDVPNCVFIEGRATRICDACIGERRGRIEATRPLTGFGGAAALISAVVAVPISAVIAAALQIAWESLLLWWGNGKSGAIHAPALALFALAVAYGFAVAAPIAIAVRQIRTRGDRFAAGVALVACLLSALIAEILVIAWFIGHESDWPLGDFITTALRLSWENAGAHTIVRVTLAAIAGVVAATLVRPKKPAFFD